MAVELMGFPKLDEQKAIQEAASEGMKGMAHLIRILSHQPSHLNTDLTDVTVSKFKKLISLLNRTGHARFRRAPVHSPQPVHPPAPLHHPSTSSSPLQLPPLQNPNFSPPPHLPVTVPHAPASVTLDFTKPHNAVLASTAKSVELEFSKETFSVSSNSSFLSSAITGDGSVSNGKQGSAMFLAPPPPTSAGKPPPFKKRCHEHSDDVSGSSKCHCVKRRYSAFHPIVT